MAARSSSEVLQRLVSEARVLVTVGAGGVGKTTIAGCLGLLAARQGRRTLVMTIDPARRLAVSLGLQHLDHQPRVVPAERMAALGLPAGLLHAMMLDQKCAFDEVVQRNAPDDATAKRILANKLYRVLSSRLAGGQEYAAIEKLHEALLASDYDLLVLDTPPAANALDFLEAPQKMVALLDGPAVRIFVRSYEQAGRFTFNVLSMGASYVFKRLVRFVGGAFLDDVAEFFGDMHALLPGFRGRAAEVKDLFAQDSVNFVLVASPLPAAVDEAAALADRLVSDGMTPAAFVINRMHPVMPELPSVDQVAAELRALSIPEGQGQQLAPLLWRSAQRMGALGQADAAQVARLKRTDGGGYAYLKLPLLRHDVHDLTTLATMADHMIRQDLSVWGCSDPQD